MNHSRKDATKVAYSTVMADLLHYGHLRILNMAKDSADVHICGLLSDEICQKWWGFNVCNFEERKAVLESMNCIDRVIIQRSIDPTENLKLIKGEFPNSKLVFVHGNDWPQVPGIEYIKRNGIEVLQPKYYDRLSREKIIRGLTEEAIDPSDNSDVLTSDYLLGEITSFTNYRESEILSNKADTLVKLAEILNKSKIEKMFVFSVKDFIDQSSKVIDSIIGHFSSTTLIVRSSSSAEDQLHESNAGKFVSVLNVNSEEIESLKHAIEQVIVSYKKHDLDITKEKILIQEQSRNIAISGVVFTRDLRTNSHYYLVNYDDESGVTDTVTGGYVGKNVRLFRGILISECPNRWRSLLESIREIEQVLPGMVLDIEFGIDDQDRIIVYQVRPLASNLRFKKPTFHEFNFLMDDQILRYNEINNISDGQSMLLSDMAFWNPSELIGDNPRRLEYSLLRKLITEKSWNIGLLPLGYSKVKEELMIQLGNKPYIRLDCVFNALIPVQVEKSIRDKLVRYYSKRIIEDISAHDKIEFDILISCWDFNCWDRISELRKEGFKTKELKDFESALIYITRKCISGYNDLLPELNKDINKLVDTTDLISKSMQATNDIWSLAKMFNLLIDDIIIRGTTHFSTVARLAFISRAICDSLVSTKDFSEQDISSFYTSIRTIASEFREDFILYKNGKQSKQWFIEKYGHLRVGTFNIMAPTYRDVSFGSLNIPETQGDSCDGNESPLSPDTIADLTKDSPLHDLSGEVIYHFLRSSIQQRELFKFQFTKPLSLALDILTRIGEIIDRSPAEMSFLDVNVVQMIMSIKSKNELLSFIDMNIDYNQKLHENNSKLVLPPVIKEELDLKVVNFGESRPNFVTQNFVKGSVLHLTNHNTDVNLNKKIVMIESADPGYDWIFTHNIYGLITKYGGAASHMAIRSAEFNIPAAIGCGSQLFEKVLEWNYIKLDCEGNRILPFL